MNSLFDPHAFDSFGSSFVDLVSRQAPGLLPTLGAAPPPPPAEPLPAVPRGTTILALRYADGVVIAGDRQATEGYQVAARRIEKVTKTDDYSAIAIAGTAGPCLEMARLFQTELAHYEKLEGVGLSVEGKANKLAQMVRMNLPMAMQGLVVIPLFVGFDLKRGEGRIYKYDLTGGRYDETDYYATGSGGKDARATMKKLYRKHLAEEEAVRIGLEALYDAAEEDVGTAGPDFVRGIFPTVKLVGGQGIVDVGDEQIRRVYETIIAARQEAA